MAHNDPELWSLSDIKENLEEGNEQAKYFIQIPKFQRSYVWKDDQIKKLVDSIYRGYPIGSLLAFKTSESRNGKNVLQLVDGLQRVTAISKYLTEPLKYAPIEESVDTEFLDSLSSILFDSSDEQARAQTLNKVRVWFDTVQEFKYGEIYNFSKLAAHLAEGDDELRNKIISLDAENSDGAKLLGRVLEAVSEVINYKVPISIYSGPIENVPTIFERINSQGTQLSKYQILAASWSRTQVEVRNPHIAKAIREKYEILIQQGYEVEGFDELASSGSAEYNLYEYLFGLGKVLAKNFPTLFHSSAQADENSPVAFQIFTVAMQLPVARMANLAEKMPRLQDGIIDITKIELAVLNACTAVENALSQFLSLRLNEQNIGPSGISQNQAISFINGYLSSCYNAEFVEHDAVFAEQLTKNIPGHFLLDMLRGSWSNAVDTTLYERTWQTDSASSAQARTKVVVPANYYTTAISANALSNAFNQWHAEQLDAKQTQRVRYPKDIKPVLKFIYSSLVTTQEDKGIEFELEHLYPVALLKKLILDEHLDGLPMGAVGNLMLLPKGLNRNKKEQLLGDYVLTNPNASNSEHELEVLQKYLIAPELTDISLDKGVSETGFMEFCTLRANAMIAHLVRVLKLT